MVSFITEHIYTLSDPRNNSIRYVGRTNNLQSRYGSHLNMKESNVEKNQWIGELKEAGLKPIMTAIETVTYRIPAKSHDITSSSRERYWEAFYREKGYLLFNKPPRVRASSGQIVFLGPDDTPSPFSTTTNDVLRAENDRLIAENARLHKVLRRLQEIIGDELADCLISA